MALARVLHPLDLARSIGPSYAWTRRDQARRWEGLRPTPRTLVYRAIWTEAAEALGAEVKPLTEKLLEIRRGSAMTRVSHQWVALGDPVAIELADDKALVHRLLAHEGLRVPTHVEVSVNNLGAAEAFLAAEESACVVKPAAGTGAGWAVTPAVARPSQLRRAVLSAARYGPRVLVERQVAGEHYRVLLLDGVVLGIVRRGAPTVCGDGHSTLRELVVAENERRIAARGGAGLWLLRADLDCVFTLEQVGLGLDSVPGAGERVTVKTATGENAPGDNETVPGPLSPAFLAEARRAAELLGLRLVGLDVISPHEDLTGATIIEVNGSPGLTYHRHVADPTSAAPVAVPLLETLLREAESR